ncbi:MAG: hypothetical protein JWO35_372 [Candidatus Saccharibacteria bacterium]|nr:hypothetical protein [Candidatus Saccharibacteria bacterium]
MTWSMRLKDLYFMVAALFIAVLAALLVLDRDDHISMITGRAFDNFFDFVARTELISKTHLSSALLAHTVSAFLLISTGTILWILFRPYKVPGNASRDDAKLKELLGHHSTSSEDYFKFWPADKNYFWQKDQAGFIAYKTVGPVIFALADPIAGSQSQLLKDFLMWTRAHRLKTCFLPVNEDGRRLYEKAGLELVQIGSSAIVNTQEFLLTTGNDKWWRWQKNRAKKNNYNYVQSHPPHSAAFMKQLKTVSDAWLQAGGRKERGFALGYFDEGYLQKCIIHSIKLDDGKTIAFTNQLPEFKPSSTATVDLLRYLPDANNAMPYLLYETIATLAANEYEFFDLGFVPFAKAKGQLLTIAQAISGGRFSSKGLEQFKNKFDPDWQPNYMAYERDVADFVLIALNIERLFKPEID